MLLAKRVLLVGDHVPSYLLQNILAPQTPTGELELS